MHGRKLISLVLVTRQIMYLLSTKGPPLTPSFMKQYSSSRQAFADFKYCSAGHRPLHRSPDPLKGFKENGGGERRHHESRVSRIAKGAGCYFDVGLCLDTPPIGNISDMQFYFSCDVQAACGLLSRPLFPVIWDSQPISPEVRRRIFPSASSPLNNLAVALCANPVLSQPLVTALEGLRDVLFFEDFHSRDSRGLTTEELEMFRFLSHEVEHELLDYPYRTFKVKDADLNSYGLHPLEEATRIAALCLICVNVVVSPPASGLCRSLVKRMKNVLIDCPLDCIAKMPTSCLDLLAWATFLGACGSCGQVERPWFARYLMDIMELRGWQQWTAVEELLRGYLYVPRLHEKPWRRVWDEALATSRLTNIEE